jgi:hypothetical protein
MVKWLEGLANFSFFVVKNIGRGRGERFSRLCLD